MHATPRDGIILFFILFQFAAVAAMFAVRGPARRAGRLLAGLFLVNAVITAILWMYSPLVHETGQQLAGDALNASRSLDVLTLYLIGALAFAGWKGSRDGRHVAWVVGIGCAAAAFTWLPSLAGRIWTAPAATVPGMATLLALSVDVLEWHVGLFNLAVALVILVLARGPGWSRWVALALAPRVLYWAVFGLDTLLAGARTHHAPSLIADVTQPLAGAIVLYAMVRVAREGQGPSTPVTVATLLVGPMIGFAQVIELRLPDSPGGSILQILNLATLALVRPLVATLGLTPDRLVRTTAHATVGTAVAFVLLLGGGLLLGAETRLTAMVFALTAALVVILVMEGTRHHDAAPSATPRGPPQPGDVVADRYVVAEPLGQGATGITVAAHDRERDVDVALKVLRPGVAPDMADRERRAMEALDHPNVVTCYGVEASPWGTVLALERVHGPTLEDRLADGPLDGDALKRLGHELLDALGAVHGAGLLHRDVKPGNLLLAGDGTLKLTDFNVARVPDLDATLSADDPAALPVGTLRYMAPEVARGLPAGRAADLYAAGAVLYEAAAGQPYVARRPGEGSIHLRDRVARLGTFNAMVEPPTLGSFFARALHPDEDARFASAAAMRAAWLEALRPPPGP